MIMYKNYILENKKLFEKNLRRKNLKQSNKLIVSRNFETLIPPC